MGWSCSLIYRLTCPSDAKQRPLQVLRTSTKSRMQRPVCRSHSFKLRSALLLAALFVSAGLQSRLRICTIQGQSDQCRDKRNQGTFISVKETIPFASTKPIAALVKKVC